MTELVYIIRKEYTILCTSSYILHIHGIFPYKILYTHGKISWNDISSSLILPFGGKKLVSSQKKSLSIWLTSKASTTFPDLDSKLLCYSPKVYRNMSSCTYLVCSCWLSHPCLWPQPEWPHRSGLCLWRAGLQWEERAISFRNLSLSWGVHLSPVLALTVSCSGSLGINRWAICLETLFRNCPLRVNSMFLLCHLAPLTTLDLGQTPDPKKVSLILCLSVIYNRDEKSLGPRESQWSQTFRLRTWRQHRKPESKKKDSQMESE